MKPIIKAYMTVYGATEDEAWTAYESMSPAQYHDVMRMYNSGYTAQQPAEDPEAAPAAPQVDPITAAPAAERIMCATQQAIREWAIAHTGAEYDDMDARLEYINKRVYQLTTAVERESAADPDQQSTPADEAPQAAPEAAEEATTNEQKEEVPPMAYTITHNDVHNSVEIAFDGKPAEPIREALKALKFRWHRQRRIWYGYTDEQTARAAIEAAEAAAMTDATKPAQQDHIRIYYNGLKIDGGKLVRCFYSMDNDCTVKGECVSISARDYADLPRDLLPVTNDTDTYTDYFDSDRATITPAHPLYRYFRYAAMKSEARDNVRYCERLRQQLSSGRREPWPGHFDTIRRDLETREAQISAFEAMTDPGQPTAADLEAIDKRRQEAENARRAAEHAAELAERERILKERNEGRRFIEATAAAHPIEADAPAVVIRWSEHPAFSAYDDDALKLSIAAADKILQSLDLKQHNTRETEAGHGWYYKTKFRIIGTGPECESIDYEGRFDIGDGEGGLINHIRNWGEWCRTHDAINRELDHPADTNDILLLADYLEQFTA